MINIEESKSTINIATINQLTQSVGWEAQYYKSEEIWQKVLSGSSYIAYIKENNELIAFGRIVEDGKMCMFYDICVHPSHQGKGLGTAIMNHLLGKIKISEYTSIGLFTWEGNQSVPEFYRKLGFEKSSAMELKKYQKS